MLTIFIIAKPSQGHRGIIQHNASKSQAQRAPQLQEDRTVGSIL